MRLCDLVGEGLFAECGGYRGCAEEGKAGEEEAVILYEIAEA